MDRTQKPSELESQDSSGEPVAGSRPVRSARAEAVAYGIDLSLLDSNLRLSPEERIRRHSRALAVALELRRAMEQRRA